MDSTDQIALPRFKCHKIVYAAKIVAIDFDARLDLAPHGVVEVSTDWVHSKKPEVGGYYVVYDDGYTSYSPAKAFEDGYSWDPLTTRPNDDGTAFPSPGLTSADIEANIVSQHFFTASEGVYGAERKPIKPSPRSGHVLGDYPLALVTFCVLVLRNGFTVAGESYCADPAKFDADIGKAEARDNAIQKVWAFMTYAQRNQARAEAVPA